MTIIIYLYMVTSYGFNLGWFIFAVLLWVIEFMTYLMYSLQGPPDDEILLSSDVPFPLTLPMDQKYAVPFVEKKIK
jgi:hypothetical protein